MSFASDTRKEFATMFKDFVADVAGDDSTIVFEKLTANAPVALFTVKRFELDERTAQKTQLPPEVQYELRVLEEDLKLTDIRYASSIKHISDNRTIRYTIIRPSPFFPARFSRLWRFWLSPAEIV